MKLDLIIPTDLHPYVAGIVTAMEFGRAALKRTLQGLTPEQLAATAPGFANSIATLVVHLAGYEIVCAHRILGTPMPDELKPEFLRDRPQNPIPVAIGETVETLIDKLDRSRAYLVKILATVTPDDLEREFQMGPERTATVRWLLGLIPYHQDEHLGQMLLLKKLVSQ
jgi:hypothetical protein